MCIYVYIYMYLEYGGMRCSTHCSYVTRCDFRFAVGIPMDPSAVGHVGSMGSAGAEGAEVEKVNL